MNVKVDEKCRRKALSIMFGTSILDEYYLHWALTGEWIKTSEIDPIRLGALDVEKSRLNSIAYSLAEAQAVAWDEGWYYGDEHGYHQGHEIGGPYKTNPYRQSE